MNCKVAAKLAFCASLPYCGVIRLNMMTGRSSKTTKAGLTFLRMLAEQMLKNSVDSLLVGVTLALRLVKQGTTQLSQQASVHDGWYLTGNKRWRLGTKFLKEKCFSCKAVV